jgi:N-acetylmuramoyl-L-alanine amidase
MIGRASKRLPKLTKKLLEVKRSILLFGVLVFLLTIPVDRLQARIDSLKTVVIDAGHGGNDPGAIGSSLREKDVTLKLALKLGKLIKETYPEVNVIYTRSTDVFIELYRRAQIANNAKADLFISIHCNAAKSTAAYGTETFVMGLHKSAASLEVAKLENASILLEDDYQQQYEGFDPNSPESYALFSLFQNAHIDQSLRLAAMVENEFKSVGRSSRGVKQAGFLVLWRAAMPSILIEAGFLSNSSDGKYLGSETGQDALSKAIFKAFKAYKADVDRMAGEFSGAARPSGNVQPNALPQVVSTPVQVLDTSATPVEVVIKDEYFLAVQFFTGKEQRKPNDPLFKGLKGVWHYRQGEVYKYVVGRESSMASVQSLLAEVKGKGFGDAFIVGFRNGQRIPWQEAVEKLK